MANGIILLLTILLIASMGCNYAQHQDAVWMQKRIWQLEHWQEDLAKVIPDEEDYL
jgi:hypothetical protein